MSPRTIVPLLLALFLLATPLRVRGGEEAPTGGLFRLVPEADSVAFRFLLGHATADSVESLSFGPRATFDVLGFLPELAGHRIRLGVELLGSAIDKMGTKHEIAFNPLLLDWRYDEGGPLAPYVEIGEGGLWTSLRYLSLGGKFQFASHGGFGVHAFLAPDVALSFGYRFRHISNAGLDEPNHGLNQHFLILGLTRFPGRSGKGFGLIPPADG